MRALLLASSFVVALTTAAHADWVTTVEEDLFSDGGKVAMMVGASYSSPYMLMFRCDGPHTLEVRLLEADEQSEVGEDLITGKLIVESDSGHRWSGESRFIRHNPRFIGFSAYDQGDLPDLIRAIGDAKSEVRFGFQFDEGGTKDSSSVDAVGSSAAARDILKACKLD